MINYPTTETRFMRLQLPPEGFVFEKGGVLRTLDVAYETCGHLAEDASNVVFICHALTGDSHVAGLHPGDKKPTGWWANMVRPGGGIDTDRFYVICANILGGCMGTTGPSSIDPATGTPYGSRFPEMTVGDIVRVHHLLLEQLGFKKIYAIVGGSFGGMQALEFSVRYPDFAERVICVATGASLSAQALAFDIVGQDAIEQDPRFNGGDYYGEDHPDIGLAQARKLAHITYLSDEMMKRKFGRRVRSDIKGSDGAPIFEIESYLRHQGKKFVDRFDANSYLRITHAMDGFDLATGYASLADSLDRIKAKMLLVSLSGDWLFHPRQILEIAEALHLKRKSVSYCCLEAPVGHDAFLTNIEELALMVDGFLQKNPVRQDKLLSDDDARDYTAIQEMIPRGVSSILDLASGNGELINFLSKQIGAPSFTGLDIEVGSCVKGLKDGHCMICADVDSGLSAIPADSYDCTILSESLQVMRRPDKVIDQLLRISPVAIVSFPNFGMWKVRASLAFKGAMPVTKRLPYQWYDTPNIHLCTIKDFLKFCKTRGIIVEKVLYQSTLTLSKIFNFLGAKNLGSSRVIVKIRRPS